MSSPIEIVMYVDHRFWCRHHRDVGGRVRQDHPLRLHDGEGVRGVREVRRRQDVVRAVQDERTDNSAWRLRWSVVYVGRAYGVHSGNGPAGSLFTPIAYISYISGGVQ